MMATKLVDDLRAGLESGDVGEALRNNITYYTVRCNVVGAFGLLFDFTYLMMIDPIYLVDS